MKAKIKRLDALRMAITRRSLSTQRELIKVLADMGYDVTQGTLSRDLKQLKVAKASLSNGRYVYVLPSRSSHAVVNSEVDPEVERISANVSGYVSMSFTGCLCVIHSRPGYAANIAYNIDNLCLPMVVGTISGDDTVFVALTEDADRAFVQHELEEMLQH